MSDIPTFSDDMAGQLAEILAAPQRPEDSMNYCQCAGFLFAVCCSPELVRPSDWLPIVFGEESPAEASLDETRDMLRLMMAFYNRINGQVFEGSPELPVGCQLRDPALHNLDDDAPLSHWARGFLQGHDWLSELWDEYTPDALDEELGSMLMILSFFANRRLAEAFHAEAQTRQQSLEQMCETIVTLLPEGMAGYAHLGRSIAQALQQDAAERHTPARSLKVGRNEPCPCGSGRKYKKCCGASVH